MLMSMFAQDVFWDGRARSVFLDPLDAGNVIIAAGGALENQAVAPILSNVEMAHDGRTWGDVTNKLALVDPLAVAGRVPPDMADALVANPSYEEVSSGRTGHVETVRVVYDPSQITYRQLLEVFFTVAHDPTLRDRQGPDVGPQYRAIAFFETGEQREIAEA